ncbi:class I SAM-dependent methyltransferase [Kibdelosporangium philippinense]|uniref:Class I SAM-dependent methyltransferase n=1 Tax=Kibdelosporangium philippinense TaxID=211113 RepID=A0ABS8Z6X2_9PSEU|nr:daptide-type RiPP biosynthesis methyltransferase [Kibdelosporangium philippinense]MCE7003157.1 class I SAM-dependent methyltransferase [Kibdelosporangium philippinense]
MTDQMARAAVRTTRANVLLASAGERGVLCDFYSETAADIYQDIMGDGDKDGSPEAGEYATHIRPEAGPVLELAAGTGRLTFPLLDLGLEVTALELSAAMLGGLQKRLAEAPTEIQKRCTVVHGDMSAFSLDTLFGTVMISSGSINVLDDADRPGVYASVRDHLAPEGRFLLGVAISEAVEQDAVERQQELPGRSGRRYVLHARQSPTEEIHEITIYPADETAAPFLVCTNRVRLLKQDQVVRELEQAGFDVIARTPFSSPGAEGVLLLEAVVRG